MKQRLAMLAAGVAVVMLSGCAGSGLSTRDDDKAYVNASIGPVNHTDQFLYMFSVGRVTSAGARSYGWRNAGSCCVRLPRVYRPGLTVDIDYDLLINDGKDDNWKTKTGVPVEPYAEPGDVYVHFFPNDQIRVVVSNPGPRSSKHPIPRPVDPNRQRGGQDQ
ncbi:MULTISPECIES: DUF3304 domain-containing protein [Cupriavidus]